MGNPYVLECVGKALFSTGAVGGLGEAAWPFLTPWPEDVIFPETQPLPCEGWATGVPSLDIAKNCDNSHPREKTACPWGQISRSSSASDELAHWAS